MTILTIILCGVVVAKDDCITHPGQATPGCLKKNIPCDIDKCSWCQGNTCIECLPRYFMDFNLTSCQKCTKGCSICIGPGPLDCVEASSGHILHKSGKVTTCKQPGCSTCIPHPDKKQKSPLCALCKPGYFPQPDHSNAEGMHFHCTKCKGDNCLYCDRNPSKCEGCKRGFKLRKGVCEKVVVSGECKKRARDGVCLDCPIGEQYSYFRNRCVKCGEGCEPCSDDNECRSCVSGYFYDKKSKSCVPCNVPGCKSCLDNAELCDTCLLGKYFDLKQRKCLNCHSDCSACTGPNPTDCLLCKPGKRYQSIIYVDAPDKAYKAAKDKMKSMIGNKIKSKYFLEVNLHPFEERRCVDKCLTKDAYPGRFKGTLPSYSHAQCPALNVLHEQAVVADEQDDL